LLYPARVPLSVSVGDDYVAVVEFDNPPHNHFDIELLGAIADAYEEIDADPRARAILLCSKGRHFCAGADFGDGEGIAVRSVYDAAYRMFNAQTPVVAAVQGAAVGGGLGLAMSADFRVATSATRFQANFVRLGLHHGFGLTVSLPRVVGAQTAAELLLAAAPVKGEEALAIGLCDGLASEEPADDLRTKARDFAAEIAAGAPLAVRAVRATMRGDLADRIREATAHEAEEQVRLFATDDFKEGVKASAERRPPRFTGT
jgi:2-(1,2-epoxy-1,2-dihydrophenyl)acetyl-CoA isomerase